MITVVHNITIGNIDYITVNDEVRDYEYSKRNGMSITDDQLLYYIRKREYPEAEGRTLEEIEQWLTDNPDVEPLPWASTHPKEATQEYQEDLTNYKNSPLYNKTIAQIDTLINNATTDPQLRVLNKEMARVLKILMHKVEE